MLLLRKSQMVFILKSKQKNTVPTQIRCVWKIEWEFIHAIKYEQN